MYFPDRGCVCTVLTLYVYATAVLRPSVLMSRPGTISNPDEKETPGFTGG